MNAESIVSLALGCVVVWLVVAVVHAAILAANKRCEPLPPELPEHGADHGRPVAHGHGAAHH